LYKLYGNRASIISSANPWKNFGEADLAEVDERSRSRGDVGQMMVVKIGKSVASLRREGIN
jgi:hypothetical protein